jgi:hypothetical protein
MGKIDQVVRLQEFQLAHPEVKIIFVKPCWEARIPDQDGEHTIIRIDLSQLLDRLEKEPFD